MADRDFVLAPQTTTVTVKFGLEPVYNALESLSLLAYPDSRSGFGEWVTNTAAALPPEVKHRHHLIFVTELYHSLEMSMGSAASFPAFLDALAAEDGITLRDRAVEWAYSGEHDNLQPPNRETLFLDVDAYRGFVERLYAHKLEHKPEEKDNIPYYIGLHIEAHALMRNPPAMKNLLVSHMRQMWDEWMAPEWAHVEPMLHESVNAFRQLDYSRMTALEAVRAITGRDLSGIWDQWGQELMFVPSAHIGPYVSRMDTNGMTRVIFGARLPEGARISSPALNRSELLVRLSALADDTRLRILEVLTQHNELCAQDMIEMLNLSQSAASRHLRQLTATGYLIERRREVAKCYSLNPKRVDDTLRALSAFLTR